MLTQVTDAEVVPMERLKPREGAEADYVALMAGTHELDANGNLVPRKMTHEAEDFTPRSAGSATYTADTVQTLPVEWLWKYRIPKHMLTIQDGDPKQGKSLVLLDLAARVSTNGLMPDKSFGSTGHVLLLASEDSISRTVVPRLIAAGADLTKIHFLSDEEVSIPDSMAALEEAIIKDNIVLLIIDPIMQYLSPWVKEVSDKSVRQALRPLAAMADRTGCGVMLNRHWGKTTGRAASKKGLGSTAFSAVCRSGWALGSFPSEPTNKYMTMHSGTLAPDGIPNLKFITEADADIPHVVWLGTTEVTADQLAAANDIAPSEVDAPGASNDASNFLLLSIPENTEVSAAHVIKDAAELNISKATLDRARRALNIQTTKTKNGWVWKRQDVATTIL